MRGACAVSGMSSVDSNTEALVRPLGHLDRARGHADRWGSLGAQVRHDSAPDPRRVVVGGLGVPPWKNRLRCCPGPFIPPLTSLFRPETAPMDVKRADDFCTLVIKRSVLAGWSGEWLVVTVAAATGDSVKLLTEPDASPLWSEAQAAPHSRDSGSAQPLTPPSRERPPRGAGRCSVSAAAATRSEHPGRRRGLPHSRGAARPPERGLGATLCCKRARKAGSLARQLVPVC